MTGNTLHKTFQLCRNVAPGFGNLRNSEIFIESLRIFWYGVAVNVLTWPHVKNLFYKNPIFDLNVRFKHDLDQNYDFFFIKGTVNRLTANDFISRFGLWEWRY